MEESWSHPVPHVKHVDAAVLGGGEEQSLIGVDRKVAHGAGAAPA